MNSAPESTNDAEPLALQKRGRVILVVCAEHICGHKRDVVFERQFHEAHAGLEVQNLFSELTQDLQESAN